MTLRLRLVLALAVLMTVGLAIFGVTTYVLYARTQYERLDAQLRSSIGLASAQLRITAGLEGPSQPTFPGTTSPIENGGPPGAPSIVLPPGTYAQLVDADGTTLARTQATSSDDEPQIPDPLPQAEEVTFTTVPSTNGSGDWRMVTAPAGRTNGATVAVAVPLAEVTSSLDRLVLIELAVAGGLVVVLSVGAWLILRRELHPLERMATTAGSITAGALDQRVEPDDGRSEVGQLGLAINTMLSELEQAFHERDATEQRLRQFLSDASHELRTPLTSIQGFAELFRLGAADGDHVNLEVMMRRIEEESARMETLVGDLLLLARLDETRPADHGPVDLAVLAADSCSDAAAVDASRSITLDAPEPVVVLGDEGQLRQAITNLMTNALRHTPAGTAVEVGAHVRDGSGLVEVRDHGTGLSDEARLHAFDRFWQADDARVGPGAGLGLSIVAAVADEHGGSVTAVNASGGGACFTLRLPLGGRRLPPDPPPT